MNRQPLSPTPGHGDARTAPDERPTVHHRRGLMVGAVAVTVGLALGGCSAIGRPGPTTDQTRDVTGATAVVLSTSGRLVVEIGEEPALTVTAGENVIDLLTSEVRDGVLVLGMRSGYWGRTGDVEYHLVLPDVERITLAGSGDVQADLPTARSLDVSVSGSGNLDATGLDVDALAVSIEGSGTATLEGSADNEDVRISGSGAVEAEQLTAENAVVLVEGSGDANLHVTGSLDATVKGSGSVHHSGGAEVTQNVSGSGDVVGD